ncbi:hypothetical protein [Streptomyces lydicus]|uniref:hypothetical protein n=1 Tax=Streptomyces lydicus TaxID=47763 RepID=UPI0013DDF8F2|nr:hypothetical protein [Streptomyces lydicus]
MSTRPSPRIVDVDAGNDAGSDAPGKHATSLGVDGENFTPGGKAHFVFTGKGKTLAQGTADVDQKGFVSWEATVKPALGCGGSVGVVGKDLSSGKETGDAFATIFCPGDSR